MISYRLSQHIWPQAGCLWWLLYYLYLRWAWAFPLSPWASLLPVTLHWWPHWWQVLPPTGPPPLEVFIAPCHWLGIASPWLSMSCRVIRLSKCSAAGAGWHNKGERHRYTVGERMLRLVLVLWCQQHHRPFLPCWVKSCPCQCVKGEWRGHSMFIGCWV